MNIIEMLGWFAVGCILYWGVVLVGFLGLILFNITRIQANEYH